jgi:CzcA family heavy metal efflux pump
MWIVRIALQKPYTFIVLALLLFILGILAILNTPKDIFPNINIPVVSVVWSYTGFLPEEMAGRITGNFERAVTTTVNDIEHIESQSLLGVSVVKIFFHPATNIAIALSQVTAISQTLLKTLPPGITPPLVLSYNASSVPIIQLVLRSPTLSDQELFDLGNNFIRNQLAVVEGASIPYPYGGKVRQIQVDLNPQAMQAYGISAQTVNNTIQAQNLIIPAGTQKIGLHEFFVKLNASPVNVNELNNLPIRAENGAVLYVRDVAYVRNGYPPQTNIVLVNGSPAVLMTIQKTGGASTLDIVQQVKAILPQMMQTMPPALQLSTFADQSIFVKAAINSLLREGALAAILTMLMIMFFVGSFRSTFIIMISIPLSMLASFIALYFMGHTINTMTLGGLALAVGILVDDATVAIENINYHLEMGKDIEQAILDGAKQITIPTFVSTLSICIVFVSMFLLSGVARYLFIPLAEAVIFAMLASYILSRTLVSTLAKYWLKKRNVSQNDISNSNNFLTKWQHIFEKHFQTFRNNYHDRLEATLKNKNFFIMTLLAFFLASLIILTPWLGTDFFPSVDAGQIKLHVRGPSGLRIEETAKLCSQIDAFIRQKIPPKELGGIVENIGLPVSGINLSYSNSSPVGAADADILISLNPGHRPSDFYIKKLRRILREKFPGVSFSFLPADMVTQILNFGLPAPIDIQITGLNLKANHRFASKLLQEIKNVPGIVDSHIQQAFNYPQLNVQANRSLAKELGFTQFDIANNMLITLSGSFQTSPTFWLDTKTNVQYPIATQTPQYYVDTLQALKNILIAPPGLQTQILGAVSNISAGASSIVESHYNAQPTIDIFASLQDRDLGSIASDIKKIIAAKKKELPRGSTISARGQIETQAASFRGLYFGLVFAIILVYFLMVINFQSWVDPLIIITALPAALAGIVWMLFLTHTTLSVPALIGSIMCMGVATANSILVVSFAREGLNNGEDAFNAALNAGFTRLRPVLMTALAMILGMLPMAIGIGEGSEENIPLGRAVIGGLAFATVATLFFVPSIFCLIHGRKWKANE